MFRGEIVPAGGEGGGVSSPRMALTPRGGTGSRGGGGITPGAAVHLVLEFPTVQLLLSRTANSKPPPGSRDPLRPPSAYSEMMMV